jgi:hypothetical protein
MPACFQIPLCNLDNRTSRKNDHQQNKENERKRCTAAIPCAAKASPVTHENHHLVRIVILRYTPNIWRGHLNGQDEYTGQRKFLWISDLNLCTVAQEYKATLHMMSNVYDDTTWAEWGLV